MEIRPADEDAAFDEARRKALALVVPAIVHRLNNSLVVVRGYCDLGARAGASIAQTAAGETERMGALLTRLSNFAGPKELDERPFVPRELLEGLRSLLEPLAQTSRCAIEVDDQATHGLALGRPALLERALATWLVVLLGRGRATAAGPEEGGGSGRRLRLVSRCEGAELVLSFDVEGGSMGDSRPPEAVVRQLERAGARVVSSEGGASLHLAGWTECQPTEIPRPPGNATGTSRARVLPVDLGDTAELVADVLREDGHEVLLAPAWAEARRELGARRFDLVLFDAARSDEQATGGASDGVRGAPRYVALAGGEERVPDSVERLVRPPRPADLLSLAVDAAAAAPALSDPIASEGP